MAETGETEERRKARTIPGIGLPAGSDYPNINEIPTEQCQEVYWRKEVSSAFEMANNGYSFYRIPETNSIFAKDLSGYWYKLNNETRCFEFLFEGFKDTTDYTRINLPPQAPTFVGFNFLHQAVFPMNDDGKPILPKDDKGKTIFPFYDGYPLFPVDDSGAICIPLGDDGKPVFPRIYEEYGAYVPCDVTGRVVLPLNEKGEPCYPRDEEGNVLMPFVISEDGTRKRAVYTDDEGTPILPFHNGEHALEVHEGEVLFQYEYQQKMMILAQYTAGKGVQTNNQLMDEQFYQQHAAHYQNQMDMTTSTSSEPSESRKPAVETQKSSPAANLLLKQLSFMKKKQTPVVAAEKATIPVERPPKPNREKERQERFIPEPIRRNRPNFRDDRTSDTVDHHRNSRRDDYRNPPRDDEKRRRERSRSLTWSPEDKKRRDKRNREKKKRGESVDDEETQRSRRRRDEKKKERKSSPSSRSSSSDSDYDRHEKRHRKREKSRK